MKPNRIRPLRALLALRALAKSQGKDVVAAARFVHATEGRAGQRAFLRLATTDAGRDLLRRRPDLRAALADNPALLALPEATLGHCHARMMARPGISMDVAQELAAAGAVRLMTQDEAWFARRQEDLHDLRHIVTGYGTDPFGELCLLAFRHAQTRHPGMGFLVLAWSFRIARELPGQPVRAALREAHRRGRESAWQDELPWEEMLAEPVGSVQARLRLADPPIYQRIAAATAPLGQA